MEGESKGKGREREEWRGARDGGMEGRRGLGREGEVRER